MLRPLTLALLLLAACNTSDPGKATPAASASQAAEVAPPAPAPAPAPAPKPTAKLGNQWKGVGFKGPESVLYDEKSDLYLVSNVDGKPYEADGKAFISKLAPMGQGVELKWIEGGKKGVTLHAPKGMAITGDTLWVADLDTVRTFNLTTGAPTGEVKIPGATFLNDLASTKDGKVLVSDTGLKPTKDGGLGASGTDAVYAIDKDRKVTTIAKDKSLGGPNGLASFGDGRVYVVTMGSGELYSLDPKGTKGDVQRMPKGTLDGIALGREHYFVSSWDANAIYRGRPGSAFELFIENVKSPADISFDRSRNRLLVPLMNEDEVRAYELP